MPWREFIGNRHAVEQVQRLVATQRAQRTVVLAGPEGVGKTTMALMLGLSLNCRNPPAAGDFCGECASCRQAVPLNTLAELITQALEHRAAEVKTAPREAAPLVLALHPAVRLYPPDGDFLTMAQARALIHQSQLRANPGSTWMLIIPEFDRARWATQAALLKTLEEPPPGVAIAALARNPLALLPTVRSRALVLTLAPVPIDQLAAALPAAHPPEGAGSNPGDAALRARLADGCPGRALRLDLAAYQQVRGEALGLLRLAPQPEAPGYALSVFHLSESTRADKEKFETLIEILYSVLQDLVHLQSGFAEGIRNVDCTRELMQLAQQFSSNQLTQAIEELDRVQAGAGRNIFRPLALESWALGLSR